MVVSRQPSSLVFLVVSTLSIKVNWPADPVEHNKPYHGLIRFVLEIVKVIRPQYTRIEFQKAFWETDDILYLTQWYHTFL